MKHIIVSIFLLFFLCSCEQKDLFDYREPFKINRNLDCELLIEKGYIQIYGEDVILIGKENLDTLIYYQIEYPAKETIEPLYDANVNASFSEEKPSNLCENGTVYWRNFQLTLDSTSALNYRNRIDTINYKIMPVDYEQMVPGYKKDLYRVINLIDKDTFHCSVTTRNGVWLFQSSITIDKTL